MLKRGQHKSKAYCAWKTSETLLR